MKKRPARAHRAKPSSSGPASHTQAPARRSAGSLGEALALLIVVGIGAALVFVFQGSPDLWDLWHARAMAAARCVKWV